MVSPNNFQNTPNTLYNTINGRAHMNMNPENKYVKIFRPIQINIARRGDLKRSDEVGSGGRSSKKLKIRRFKTRYKKRGIIYHLLTISFKLGGNLSVSDDITHYTSPPVQQGVYVQPPYIPSFPKPMGC